MKVKVSPTRMELVRLKKRLNFAYKGHKLLKDKQEELNKHFFSLFKETIALRNEIEEELIKMYKNLSKAFLYLDTNKFTLNIYSLQPQTQEIVVDEKKLLNITYPVFKIKPIEIKFTDSSNRFMDMALIQFKEIFPKLIKLSENENLLKKIAIELQTTRRRVNALEYVLIPSIKQTIKSITEKFQEIERDNISRIMKIKELRLS